MLSKLKGIKGKQPESTKRYVTEKISEYGEIMGSISIPMEVLPKNKMGIKRYNLLSRQDFNPDAYLDSIKEAQIVDINMKPNVSESEIQSLKMETLVLELDMNVEVEQGVNKVFKETLKETISGNKTIIDEIFDIPDESEEKVEEKIVPKNKPKAPGLPKKKPKVPRLPKTGMKKKESKPKVKKEVSVFNKLLKIDDKPTQKESEEEKENVFNRLLKKDNTPKPKIKKEKREKPVPSVTKPKIKKEKPAPRIRDKENKEDENVVPPHIQKLLNSSTYKVDRTIINKDEKVDGGESR